MPAVQQAAGERAFYGESSWVTGFRAAIVAMIVTFVTVLIGIVGPVRPSLFPFWLFFEPIGFLVIPTVTFFAATAVSIYRRQKRRP